MKRWNLLKSQMTWIGQSTLEVNRDGVYIIVKDQRKQVREDLTDEELSKYASSALMDHLAKKRSRAIGDFEHKDPLFVTSQANKVDYTKNRRPEKGITINVGGPPPASEPQK